MVGKELYEMEFESIVGCARFIHRFYNLLHKKPVNSQLFVFLSLLGALATCFDLKEAKLIKYMPAYSLHIYFVYFISFASFIYSV
jgi:hypothetical protein